MSAGTVRTTGNPDKYDGAALRAYYTDKDAYLNSAQLDLLEVWTGWRYVLTFHRVVDGTSNTIAFGEKFYPRSSKGGVLYNGDFQSQYIRYAGHEGTQDPVTQRWTTEHALITDSNYGASDWNVRFTAANHPGIGMFAFLDGSVQAIPASVSLEVLHRLAKRDDGEVIPGY